MSSPITKRCKENRRKKKKHEKRGQGERVLTGFPERVSGESECRKGGTEVRNMFVKKSGKWTKVTA